MEQVFGTILRNGQLQLNCIFKSDVGVVFITGIDSESAQTIAKVHTTCTECQILSEAQITDINSHNVLWICTVGCDGRHGEDGLKGLRSATYTNKSSTHQMHKSA